MIMLIGSVLVPPTDSHGCLALCVVLDDVCMPLPAFSYVSSLSSTLFHLSTMYVFFHLNIPAPRYLCCFPSVSTNAGPRRRATSRRSRRFRQARHAAGQDQHSAVLRVQHCPLDMEDGTHRKGTKVMHKHAHACQRVYLILCFHVVCTWACVDLHFLRSIISGLFSAVHVSYIFALYRLKMSHVSPFISQGGSVPWNAEVTNTDPSNFLWEKNSTAVVTVAPGTAP
jgi:hypothetical protein